MLIQTDDVHKQIVNIFNSAQKSSASHQKNVTLLCKVCKQTDSNRFVDSFISIVKYLLTQNHKVKNVHVERSITFCALFCASCKSEEDDMESEFLRKVFDFLLELQDLADDTIRYRTCQLMATILNNLVGVDLSDELFTIIQEAMLDRLRDSKHIVRLQAAIALRYVQDPGDPLDPVTNEYMIRMQVDANPMVRQACTERVCSRKDVIPIIILRTRDVNVDVRKAAFLRTAKLPLHLKIVQRQQILRNAMFDSSKNIQEFVAKTLIPSWLQAYDMDYLKLLKALRLDENEEHISETASIIEYVLGRLFVCRPHKEILEVLVMNKKRVIPLENLNWETVIYWRFVIEHLRKNDDYEDALFEILPEPVHFCSYIKKYYKSKQIKVTEIEYLEFQFIIQQMFYIIQGCDLSDVASYDCVNVLISNILKDVELTTAVTLTIVDNLEKTLPEINQQIQFITEIVSDILYPPDIEKQREKDVKIAVVKLKLNILNEEKNQAVKEQDYETAGKCQKQLLELKDSLQVLEGSESEPQAMVRKDDIETLKKYLDIACALLNSQKITSLSPALENLTRDVLTLLVHEDDNVRCKALKCYGLCCLIDRETARRGIHILCVPILTYQAGCECDVQILIVSICAVSDLLLIYGSSLITATDEVHVCDGNANNLQPSGLTKTLTMNSIIQGLVDLMDVELAEIQLYAGRGLNNLIMHGCVNSPTLISRMIIKWCHPDSDDLCAEKLKQYIAQTLQVLPRLEEGAYQLEKAVLPILKTLICAPDTSPLSEVNIDSVTKFILELCSACKESSNIYYNLAISLCLAIKEEPESICNPIYVKTLLMLDVPKDGTILKDVIKLIEEIRNNVNNKRIIRYMEKFMTQIENCSQKLSSVPETDVKQEVVDGEVPNSEQQPMQSKVKLECVKEEANEDDNL